MFEIINDLHLLSFPRRWYVRLNAKCFGSSYKQEESPKKKMTSDRKIKKETSRKKKDSQENSEDDTQEGSSTDTDCNQDSDVSFAKDSDKEIDTAELEQEDWVGYMKRSTAGAEEKIIKPRVHVGSKCTEE